MIITAYTTTTTVSSMNVLILFVFAYMVAIETPFSVKECQGFSLTQNPFTTVRHRVTTTRRSNYDNTKNFNTRNTVICIQMATADNNDAASLLSDDPFVILGLDEPTTDKKIIKRAYKRRALKFHPDAITDLHSSPEDKKKASDLFAKVNWAYATLTGKNKDSPSSTGRSSSSSSSSSSGWTPPHRRSGAYSSSSTSSSENADWRDYIPNYGSNKDTNDKDYDTGGDSFGQIFSDLFTSAANGVSSAGISSGGGIFSEFMEFLEGNVGGGGNNDGSNLDDADLRILLKTGSLEEVAEEMDDTELVVQQLDSKATILDDELFGIDAEAKMTSKFSEKIELEERASELKARKDVVGKYLKRARTRLLSLQTRYKDLITYEGANDSYASSGGRRRSDRQSTSSSSQNDVRGSNSSYSSTSSGRTSSTSTTGGSDSDGGDDVEDSWKTEGFGSSGRSRGSSRRGSGRRRASRRTTAASPSASGDGNGNGNGKGSSTSYSSSPPPSSSPSRTDAPYSSSSASTTGSRRQSQPERTTTSSSSSSSSLNKYGEVPPHRRTQSSYVSRQEEDKQRMREIKVDEEFDKLKKQLGL